MASPIINLIIFSIMLGFQISLQQGSGRDDHGEDYALLYWGGIAVEERVGIELGEGRVWRYVTGSDTTTTVVRNCHGLELQMRKIKMAERKTFLTTRGALTSGSIDVVAGCVGGDSCLVPSQFLQVTVRPQL
ncbi:hypothetical protein ACFX2F_022261 [Malus domestica]